jgi:hypothetical protein
MDRSNLQSFVSHGWSRAASILGGTVQQYRPIDLMAPLSTVHDTILASFSANFKFGLDQPQMWGTPLCYGLFSSNDILVGDILTDGSEAWFVASYDGISQPLCVLCNHSVSICDVTGSSVMIARDWPCSITMKTRSDRSESGLPGAIMSGQYMLHFPYSSAAAFLPYMTAIAENGVHYTIESAESSNFGWRFMMSVQQV